MISTAPRPHTTTNATTTTMSTSSIRANRATPRAVFARTVRGTTRDARRETTRDATRFARVDKAGPMGHGTKGRRVSGAGRREGAGGKGDVDAMRETRAREGED